MRNKCNCGSYNTKIEYADPCDFRRVKCLDCGTAGELYETREEIEKAWMDFFRVIYGCRNKKGSCKKGMANK